MGSSDRPAGMDNLKMKWPAPTEKSTVMQDNDAKTIGKVSEGRLDQGPSRDKRVPSRQDEGM